MRGRVTRRYLLNAAESSTYDVESDPVGHSTSCGGMGGDGTCVVEGLVSSLREPRYVDGC